LSSAVSAVQIANICAQLDIYLVATSWSIYSIVQHYRERLALVYL